MSEPQEHRDRLWGLLAEFSTPADLLHGCQEVRNAGFSCFDAHTPFPVHGLGRAMGVRRSPVGWFALVFGLGAAAAGMLLQGWVSTTAYPLLISGKPLFSWPAFVPIAFECGILGAALGAVVGFLWLSRLPRPHHPLFESRAFEGASDHRFFLSVEARDPKFDGEKTSQFLTALGAVAVEELLDPDGGAS